MTYENHPYAEVWPSLDGAEFDKLVEDIRANGQRLPIVLHNGKILDGRNRYRACKILGIAPKTVVYSGTDEEAKAMVRSLNEHRRHLTVAQRNEVKDKLLAIQPEKSNRQIAEEAQVSEVTVRRARSSGAPKTHLNKVIGRDGKRYKARQESLEAKTERDAMIKASYAAGKSQEQIAHELSLAKSTVWAVLKKNGGRDTKPKLTPMEKLRVKQMGNRLPVLTREEVDPEFKGTAMEWVDKYGHVQTQTAEQRATHRFKDWAIEIGHLGRLAKDKVKTLPDIDLDWLRSPRVEDVERLRVALEILRPMLARAEELLKRAQN
jgi:ParB-like chromosome segregation protein Spo0J